ncbi:uncharacterized protein LOC131882277 [Tigriopus californicus]|uniref:uncharacterized protein LOC131882277 n=1 Tax=Tigriopus californicus TaxID=6832 RepID=UPI0027DA18D7|nr:uncharacterized protein LOC131882277 [Tigriopus californicus]
MAPMVQLPRPTSCKVEGGGPIFIATRQFLTPPPMATHRSILRSPKEWSHDHEVPGIGRRLSSPGCSVIHMDESHGSQSQSVDIRGLILSASSGSTDKTHWYIGALRKFPMGGPTAKGGKCGPSDGHQVSPSLPESTLHESDVLSQSAVGRLWARLHNCMLGNQEALGIKLRQHVNSSWLWSPISFLSTFFRAVGQPMHVNNIFR